MIKHKYDWQGNIIEQCNPSRNIHKGDHVFKLIDANGYSCGNVCDYCYDEVKAKYNPDIFDKPYNDEDV